MENQHYKNHVRYYPPHHFVFYPVVLTGLIFSITLAFRRPEAMAEWLFIGGLFIVITWVAFMMRQHYALMTQDRIVRLEVRFRYFTLTGKRFEELEKDLSLGQILALRFASDGEFVPLVRRAIAEQLTPDEIKKAVREWLPDYMRV